MLADLWGMVNAIVVPNSNDYNADICDGFGGVKGGEGDNDSAVPPPLPLPSLVVLASEGQNFDLAKYIVSSTRYEYSIQYIVSYNTIHCFFNISFKTVCIVITKQFILSNNF
jgi:hypothetical protein